MPRRLSFMLLLLVFMFALSLSCTERPGSGTVDTVEGAVPVAFPPYRVVLVSPRVVPVMTGLPEGMVMPLKLGSGRLNTSSATWKALVDLMEDETVRAVVVADAPQGTAALFTELKELRPELLLLALSPVESPLVIQASAGIVMDFDHGARAYSAVLIASRMGRSSIVALSMPGSSDDWRSNTRQAVLRAASAEMGLTFKVLAVSPDGLEKALHELGYDLGVNSTNDAVRPGGTATGLAIMVNDGRLSSAALRIAKASGALFIELDRPEGGYSGIATDAVLSNGATSVARNVPASEEPVGALIDEARNVPGRPGLTLVWPGEQTSLLELGALSFARSIIDGRPASEVSLARAMNVVWPTGQWHASHFVDAESGVRARNHLVTGSDPYMVGRSYLSAESSRMPASYRMVRW